MRRFLFLGLCFVLLSEVQAVRAERFDAATWAEVKPYELPALQNLDRLRIGQLVELRFNYRQSQIRHVKPNWYQGSVWRYAPGEKKQFSFVQVMVPKSGYPAFKAISSDFKAGEDYVVYGQVLQDAEINKFRFIRLIGTKVERDLSGNVTVSW
jgi:hypothetical protein